MTWQEQQDQERIEEQKGMQEKQMPKMPLGRDGKLKRGHKLTDYRPSAPRNTSSAIMDSHAPTGFGVMVGDAAVGNMGPLEDDNGDNGEDMVAFGSNAGLISSQGELRDEDEEEADDVDDGSGAIIERDERIRQLEAMVETQRKELKDVKAKLAAALEQIATVDDAVVGLT
jgi:hypothetical protein